MKTSLSSFFPIIFCIGSIFTTTYSQSNSWINTGGPFKGSAISIATGSNGFVFVGTQTGIYRSTDHAQTWSLLADNPWTVHLSSSTLFPSTGNILVAASGSVFMRTDDSLVYRSTDNGDTWISLESALNNSTVRSIISSSAGDLFTLVDSMGILRSSNNGDEWTRMNLNLPISHVYSLAVDSTRLMIIRTDTCYYKSNDNGSNWLKSVGGGGNLLAIAPNRTIFTAVASSGISQIGPYSTVGIVFRSTDDGGHWTACYSITTGRNILMRPRLDELAVSSAGNVFFTTYDGVYRSTDNGDNWSMIPWDNWQLQDYSRAVGSDSENDFYIGTNQCGLLRLSNRDTAYSFIPAGFSSVMVNAIATNSSGHVFATVDSGVFRSTNNGQNWTKILAPIYQRPTFKVITGLTNSQGTIYALKSLQGNSGFLFRSIDNGDHWDSLGNRGPVLGVSPGGMIFQGIPGGLSPIYRSTDNGDNWTQFSGMDTVGDYVDPFCFAFNSQNHIFAGSYLASGWGGIWRSRDSGYTWENIPKGLPGGRQNDGVNAMGAVNVLGINSKGIIFAATDSGFYRSTNNGESWLETDQSLPPSLLYYYTSGQNLLAKYGLPKINCIAINSLDYVYVAYDRGVFYSKDNGKTWNSFIQDKNMNYSMTALEFDKQGYLYGGRGGTIYRSSSSTTSVSELPENVPGTWKLEQNYPNPFNPTTTISFTIPATAGRQVTGFVSLKIYDILGREVATLLSERLSPGNYTRQWNATNFVSGVYFYRLTAGRYVETKKLVLLK